MIHIVENEREEDMEHLEMQWLVHKDEDGTNYIVSDSDVWFVAQAVTYLPDDDDGTKTLQYICNLHNAAIAEG